MEAGSFKARTSGAMETTEAGCFKARTSGAVGIRHRAEGDAAGVLGARISRNLDSSSRGDFCRSLSPAIEFQPLRIFTVNFCLLEFVDSNPFNHIDPQ